MPQPALLGGSDDHRALISAVDMNEERHDQTRPKTVPNSALPPNDTPTITTAGGSRGRTNQKISSDSLDNFVRIESYHPYPTDDYQQPPGRYRVMMRIVKAQNTVLAGWFCTGL